MSFFKRRIDRSLSLIFSVNVRLIYLQVTAENPEKSLTFHELHTLVSSYNIFIVCIWSISLSVKAHKTRAFMRVRGFKEGDLACLVLSNCIEYDLEEKNI